MSASSNMQKPLLIVVSLLLVGSAASTYWLWRKLDVMESRIGQSSVDSGLVSSVSGDTGTAVAMAYPGQDSDPRTLSRRIAGGAGPGVGIDGISKIEELKRDTDYVPPSKIIESMERLMVNEPRNPALEAKQQRWLQESASATTGEDVPKARGVSAECQGRRCVVTASFTDAGSAHEWAMRYLLSSGGRILSRSRTVVVPGVGGASTTLQLYLF